MPTEPLRLTNARLITGRPGAAPTADAVLITDAEGRVGYAGEAATAPASPGAREVDLGGRTLLPGFIDAHVHVKLSLPQGPFHELTTDPTYVAYETAERLRATLDAGVTTARDLAGATRGVRDALAHGLIAGPRLKIAVNALSHTGGHGDFHHFDGGHIHLHQGGAYLADTPDEARRATRDALRSGADVIKICTTGGMGSPHDTPDDEGLRVDEVRAVVDEVQRHGGRPVAAHAQGLAGIHAAILGGVTSVEHGYGIDDRALDLAAERGVFLVPTLSTVFVGIDKAAMQPYHYEKKVRWSGITRTNIAHAIERGTRIAMGTDAGVVPHGRNLLELGFLVELGMSPADAIVAGTRSAAELLGVADDLGTLEAGKLADFVVSAVDPLTDIVGLGDPANVLVVAQSGVIRKDLLGLAATTAPTTAEARPAS
ncbi:metal-dependent hydrolase family protein [Streptomyces hainanensis]|uniref:Amidohydrolase family protein n=1 Tax=Streptomyces hainanensis TaxID=402648 RepID=A0A4R4TJ62_9ACTN|nr:amidohydrolase family protein [Streptomyces hainanensis]TDC77918.1 amidohydrolase family protein [Streptomyces hainanensis]